MSADAGMNSVSQCNVAGQPPQSDVRGEESAETPKGCQSRQRLSG